MLEAGGISQLTAQASANTGVLEVHVEPWKTTAADPWVENEHFFHAASVVRQHPAAALHTDSRDAAEDADGSFQQIAWIRGGESGDWCVSRLLRQKLVDCMRV